LSSYQKGEILFVNEYYYLLSFSSSEPVDTNPARRQRC